jgi:isopenicillin-N epimerase
MLETRRQFLWRSAVAALAGGSLFGCRAGEPERDEGALTRTQPAPRDEWSEVRAQFALSPDLIHMSALYVASHPLPVREAIDRYRRELDASPVLYLNAQNRSRVNDVLDAAARYLEVSEPTDIAITDSTTAGIGFVYNGLRLGPGDDAITTDQDYYVTHEALRLASERKGLSVRRVPLYDEVTSVSADSLAHRLLDAVRPETRVMAVTWVHSSTGLKLPIRRIADGLAQVNARRDEADHVLLCVDGVHGFGVENVGMGDLGCDFFMAGCHKWLFGPRGTGIVWASPRGWSRSIPIVPTFLDNHVRRAWLNETEVEGRTNGQRMSPGGFKPFEHQWAMKEAFDFHEHIGKDRVETQTHALARELKEGLARIRRVTLRTPLAPELSSGIVCCEVEGSTPWRVVDRLRERGIVATVTPYARRYVRFAPSIRNTREEVEAVLRAMRAIA